MVSITESSYYDWFMPTIPASWIPHRRDDGEVIGWIDMESHAPRCVPIDRLGRHLEPVDEWLEAEAVLEERGLSFLTGSFLHADNVVRIRHLDDRQVVVTTALTDVVGDVGTEYRLPFPPGEQLSQLNQG